jgi:hypothetical protein
MSWSIQELAAEVAREIVMRKRVYPGRVTAGKMTIVEAQEQIAKMCQIHDMLVVMMLGEQEELFP